MAVAVPTSPDQVSLRILAPADVLYDLVTDPAGMGRLSTECTGGKWLDGATGPTVGAKFKGTNKRGIARWSTVNTVVIAVPGQEFAFETKQSGTRWRYEFQAESDGAATVVTESRAAWRDRPAVAKIFSKLLLGGVEEHDHEMQAGMLATLERLKTLAEASGSAAPGVGSN